MAAPKKILFLRFSSIGDIVLTSPIIRCVKQQTNAEVHFATKKQFESILAHNPHVDKVISFEKNVDEIIDLLKAENYDLIVDLHHNLRSAVVKAKLGKPYRTFKKLNVKKFLLTALKYNKMPSVHIVDRYFKAVETLDVVNDGKGLDFFIDPKDEVDSSSLPTDLTKGYIGFVIGAKFSTKKLPTKKIISICKKLRQPLLLLGGKEDMKEGEEIKNALGNTVYNACGKYNLGQSASLVKQADIIITHDTGLMHIAAAFKKKIISVWGNTVPEFGMYPYLAGEGSKIVEVKNLSCRPCSKIGYAKCPKAHFKCMNLIDEEQIILSC